MYFLIHSLFSIFKTIILNKFRRIGQFHSDPGSEVAILKPELAQWTLIKIRKSRSGIADLGLLQLI